MVWKMVLIFKFFDILLISWLSSKNLRFIEILSRTPATM